MYNIFAIICFLKKEKLILVQNSIEHTVDAIGILPHHFAPRSVMCLPAPPIYYVPVKGLRMGVNPHLLAKSAPLNPLLNPVLPTQCKPTCRHSRLSATCLFETWLSNTVSVTPPPVFGTWQVVSGNACITLKCRNKLNQELITAFAATGYCAVLCLLFTGFKTFCVVLCRFVSFCGKWLCGMLYLCKREQEELSWGVLRRVHVQHSFSTRKSVENNE